MSSVFYKSSSDGWRIGTAEAFPNTSTVTVADGRSKLRESVRADDVFTPSTEQQGLLSIPSDAQYFEKADAVSMSPPPLELPALIETLRVRCTSTSPKGLLFLGDNIAVSTFPSEEEEKQLSARILNAVRSTGKRQVLVGSGAPSLPQCSAISAQTASSLGASPEAVERLTAAQTVMSAFTHTIGGQQRGTRCLDICTEDDNGYAYSGLQYLGQDTSAVVDQSESNFIALNFIIYTFNSEEKERCLIPNRTFDWKAQQRIDDSEVIADLRRKYFTFSRAMETLGFEIEVQLSVFARVAAVLHLLEVDFTPEGDFINLESLKRAARLVQTDFNALSKIIKSRELVEAMARLLYLSVFKYIVRSVNDALNPKGLARSAKVSIIGIPEFELSSRPLPLRTLALHTMYEDVLQCFFRSSEQEMVQWQREGFFVSDELQSVFDAVDNYSLLKVLKGKGGILSAAGNRVLPEMAEQLKKISRHARCTWESINGVLTVRHSFGTVQYQFPRNAADLRKFNTVHHSEFADLRQYLIANTDVATQEALCLVDQEDNAEDHAVAMDWRSYSATAASLSEEVDKGMFWWLKTIGLGEVFNGQDVAEQLAANGVHPVVELRALLPHRYIACHSDFVVANFSTLLDRNAASNLSDREKCEAICQAAKVHHCMGKEHVLIEASGIGGLQEAVDAQKHAAAVIVQGVAKSIVATKSVNTRVESWTKALTVHTAEQNKAQEVHRWQVDNSVVHRDQRLELQQEEHTVRTQLRDECWVAWVSLQTKVQTDLENIVTASVAKSAKEEAKLIKTSINNTTTAAIQDITRRIQSRLVEQGRHLDAVVDNQVQRDEASQIRMKKLETVNDRLLRARLTQEEARIELEKSIMKKNDRQKYIHAAREEKRESLRQDLWVRQERDRVSRVRMEKTRDAISNRMRESIVMDDIERTLAKRLKSEVIERQRREKEERERQMRIQRQQREKQLQQMEKQHARAALQQERFAKQEEEKEAARRRREDALVLTSQEKERRTAEQLRKEEEKRQKVLTRSLLKAHDMLNSPMVYEQSLRGTSMQSVPKSEQRRRHDPNASKGFVMSGQKETYPRMLNNDTWDGIISYHSARRSGRLEERMRSTGGRSQSRSASPRSVFSL